VNAASDSPHLVPGLFELGTDGPWLVGSRCRCCGDHVFPSRVVCPRCKRRSMAVEHLGRRGTLYSFTVCHAAPAGWQAPYLQAYIQLPEGLRLFSLVSSDVEPRADALTVGMAVELVVEPVQPGDPLVTYKYRPLEQHA
jgi:uncharacterized protein